MDAISKYENEIQNDFNIFKGDLLGKEEKELLFNDKNAFLIGLISDQSVKAELAWSLPFRLKERMGCFDVKKICTESSPEEITALIKEKPALHRYPSNIAKYIYSACELLVEKYDGDANNIWKNNAKASEIVSRLEEFKGISHKKAALGCLLLVRDFDIDVIDKENINIAYDIHIRRICLRAGFVKKDTIEDVMEAARKIYPPFPGRLTSSFWAIGRDICRPTEPMCDRCPINMFCEKKIELGGEIHA